MARNAQGPEFDVEFDEADDGNRPKPADWALLMLRSARRRKLLFVATFLAAFGAVFLYYRLKRPMYQVEAKILAQSHQMMPSGLRTVADDPPARTAWELIHRRENLIALIRAAKLMDVPARGPLDRLQSIAGLGSERVDPVDPVDPMVTILDRKLAVTAEEGTITISLDWPVPEQAYRVVDGAVQNFIEARHVQEVTAIDEVISVLQVRAAKAREQLDRVTDEVRREWTEGSRDTSSPAVAAARPSVTRQPSDEVLRLKTLLEGKERAIQDVEEFRRRRLADLQAQLDERRNTFSEAHPAVLQLRQDIDSLSRESPQVLALREEEAKLRKDYQTRLAQEGITESAGSGPTPAAPPRSAASPRLRASNTPIEEDERVRDARFQYQQIVEKVNSAQLELDAVRAAFKYRYNVIWPPQVPRDPISPNPRKVFGAGFLAALFLAVLVAAAPDLRSGRIVERWQVERSLGLPVLAELDKR